jgi:NADPH-dependent F420 reductase
MSLELPDIDPIALIGGTGPEGQGLALRLARAGHAIIIGSRSSDRAEDTASDLGERVPGATISGLPNREAAERAGLIILTIPFAGVEHILDELAPVVDGKIVVSAIAPVEFQEGRPVALRIEAGSAAQEVQRRLSGSRVVSAFQTIDAHRLQDPDEVLDTDVIVCSDDVEARRLVVSLAGELPGVRALSGGRLAASRYVEDVTALLITLNRIYKSHSGIRFTGIDR